VILFGTIGPKMILAKMLAPYRECKNARKNLARRGKGALTLPSSPVLRGRFGWKK
jgi:hypothetical protein